MASALSSTCLLLVIASTLSCVDSAPALDYGNPTSRADVSEQGGIYARLLSPRVGDVFAEPYVELSLAAWTDEGLPLDVQVRDPLEVWHATLAAGDPGPEQRFSLRLPLLHGHNSFRVRLATEVGSRVRHFDYDALYEGEAPGIRFALSAAEDEQAPCNGDTPLRGAVTSRAAICVRGQLSTRSGSAQVRVGLAGSDASEVQLSRTNEFVRPLRLVRDRTAQVEVLASDDEGRRSSALLSIAQDSTPPELEVELAARSPFHTSESRLRIEGSASDEHGVARLALQNGLGVERALPLGSSFSAHVELVAGENEFSVLATDKAGNQASATVRVLLDREILLRPSPDESGRTQLGLDKQALQELLSEDDQRAIEVLRLGLRAPITNVFRAIRDPELFGLSTSNWGQAERNLQRLLNMTPDTADLRGTSIEELLQVAGAVGLPPPRLLADTLSLNVTDTLMDLETAVDVTLEQLIATHPNVVLDESSGEPQMALSVYDVLQELAPIAPRFGPAEGHPGFLSGTSHSVVFEPGFLMSVPVRSNLKLRDGVDASLGRKDYLFELQGEQALDLDFMSDRFSVVGLVDEPTVDLRVIFSENPAFLRAGADQLSGPDSERAGFYRGSGQVWATPPWQFEHVVAETMYRQLHGLYPDAGYARTLRYDAGSVKDAAVMEWTRGWLDITTSGGIGAPPEPLYAWDMLSEAAQVRLHEGGLAEGAAALAFRLDGLPIGLTADQLIASLRPTLEKQKAKLSERLVGESGLAASGVDLFFVADDGQERGGFLFFRAEGDSGQPYDYAHPGFFEDAALSRKVSRKSLPGSDDELHEKVRAQPDTSYFIEDDTGALYRLDVLRVDERGVALRVVKEPP